ncbi:MAG: carboxypeptidase-like regulatory domain-containing protein [Prevotella sp.]
MHIAADNMQCSDSIVTLKGVVKDVSTKKRLANVNIYISGKDIGTVTNADGVFSLKIKQEDATGGVRFSCLGYANRKMAWKDLCGGNAESTIYLNPISRILSEVTVYGGDAKTLVKEALKKIDINYPPFPATLNMFYRETIMKGSRFVGISEGVMDVYKDGYKKRTAIKDRVRMLRGRKLLSQKAKDTLAVKIQGGPMLAIYLDIVKNGEAIFYDKELSFFSFKHEHVEMLNDRLHYVVSFKPMVCMDYPLYSGLLYIDSQSLCLTRAEMSLDVSDVEKANKTVLMKKPVGLRFRCKESSFVVAYRQHGERSYLDYIRNTIRFKCDWKRRLFSSAYTATAEMVVVDVENDASKRIPLSESYSNKSLFSDEAEQNWDKDFWKDYNIIEPTESLEKAVTKLRKQ